MRYTVTLPAHICEGQSALTTILKGGRKLYFRRPDKLSDSRPLSDEDVVMLRREGFTVEPEKKTRKKKED